jgi:hypothetical protein
MILGKIKQVSLLAIALMLISLCAHSQDVGQSCSFLKGKDITYYLNATENYATKGDLPCFCAMMDSLTQWSCRSKSPALVAIIDSVFSSTDGVFSEWGDHVAEELFKYNFTNLCKQILADKGSYLWYFLKDELVYEALSSENKDATVKKQRKIFSDKVKASKLTTKEKTKMLDLFNAIEYAE